MAVRSLTFRTSLWFSLLALGVFLVMGLFILASVQHHFGEQDRDALAGKLELIARILHPLPDQPLASDSRRILEAALVGHHDLSVQILTGDGVPFLHSGEALFPMSMLHDAAPWEAGQVARVLTWSASGESFRGVAVRLAGAASSRTSGWIVALAVDTRHHTDFISAFGRELALIGAGGLLLMAVLGWLVTRRGFRPVLEMAQVAEGISAQQLDKRLAPAIMPAELQPLARAFNGMLDRLGDSLQRLSGFSSDLAHELRTPVNNLMTQTQVCLSKPRDVNEYREVLYSNLEEFERLGRMIGDMLFLAKADHGLVVPERSPVNVRAEIEALYEFYDALAAEKQLVLSVEGEGQTSGDALMLRRAFSNLLSNALRHADLGSMVKVSLVPSADRLAVLVCNTGDTVSMEHLPRLFDRFYRVDSSRQRQDEGAGLGLAITRSIIQAHGGEVTVTSGARQTCFRVELPVAVHGSQIVWSVQP